MVGSMTQGNTKTNFKIALKLKWNLRIPASAFTVGVCTGYIHELCCYITGLFWVFFVSNFVLKYG